jgi:hypothetical protein
VTFGSQFREIPVEVIPRLSGIRAELNRVELTVDEKRRVKITADYRDPVLIDGEDVTGRVTWSSRNANVGTVNENGLITAVGNGSTAITAVYGSRRVNIAAIVR